MYVDGNLCLYMSEMDTFPLAELVSPYIELIHILGGFESLLGKAAGR